MSSIKTEPSLVFLYDVVGLVGCLIELNVLKPYVNGERKKKSWVKYNLLAKCRLEISIILICVPKSFCDLEGKYEVWLVVMKLFVIA